MRLSFSARDALRCYKNLLYVTCLLETARKKEQNNQYKFSRFYGGVCLSDGCLGFYPLYYMCFFLSETSVKTNCIIRCRNPKHAIIGTNRNNFAET